ncbi:MAG: hypothetical protein CVU06_01625 [Bacteroidetes bacterium HGW-Bacteroidetes-22]|nr:MAG: hypothetical protein CVU06_01625 [Bacteroidetes bacterium HGW-Bacteroidetes-22]
MIKNLYKISKKISYFVVSLIKALNLQSFLIKVLINQLNLIQIHLPMTLLKPFRSSKLLRITLFLSIVFLINLSAIGQQTVVTGKITDANTNEPIPFANVVLKGTTVGATSDFDGKYSITTTKPSDSLMVLVVNYKGRTKKVKKGISQNIDFQLEGATFELGEVVINAGENPANIIVRKAREMRNIYNMEKLDAYEYKSYVKTDINIDKISEGFKNSRAMKPFAYIFDSLQKAAGEDGKVVLPFFVSESLNDIYYLKNPKRTKTIVNGSKMTGLILDNFQIFEQFLGKAFQDYNFNDNFLRIFDRSFISPIAAGSFAYYEYYIMDTVMIDNHQCFELKVKSKRPQELAFNGTMWIADSTFALRRVDFEIPPNANFNFIERYKIQQDYENVGLEAWLPTKTRVLVDMQEFGDSTLGLIGKFYVANKEFVLNQPKDLKFYRDNIEVVENSMYRGDDYWAGERRKMITDAVAVEKSYDVIDSLRQSPKMTRIRKAIRIIWDGYYNFGKWQLGHWYTMVGNNKVEGFRLQATGQTTIDFSKKWILKGHLAYGFKDTKFKYNGQVEYYLNRNRWTKIGVRHQYDMERLGIDPDFLESHVFLNWLFIFSSQFGYLERMSLTNQTRFWFETDHWRGWNSKFMVTYRHFQPAGNYHFAYFDDNNNVHDNYRNSEFTFVTSYSAKRVWLVENNWRIGAESMRSPTWTFKAVLGFKGILGSDFSYQKLSLNVAQFWNTGYLGRLDYSITAQKVFGQVPYPSAIIFQGNEPIFSSEKSYNLMHFFEFAADESIEAIFLQHFDGFFFNRVPLLKRLKLREVAGLNIIFSRMSDKNNFRTVNNPDGLLPETDDGIEVTKFRTMKPEKPYVEISYGIENLFKVVRIQAYHRLSYLDKGPDGKTVFPFAIKGSFIFRL